MSWIYFLFLFLVTLAGGLVPFGLKKIEPSFTKLLLAFSGAFLFGITVVHLLPESFEELGHSAGIFIVLGFFLQLALQKYTHGMEHGHSHVHLPDHTDGHHHHVSVAPIMLGLSVHALLEGIPLGFNFYSEATRPALFLGVAAHKFPEALTLTTVLIASHRANRKNMFSLVQFALISPLAGILGMLYGQKFMFVQQMLSYMVPVVIGSFLHISTTIFYESGTKHHELSWKKILFIALGAGAAMLTLLLDTHQHTHHH
jgi:zinc transporter ZupT